MMKKILITISLVVCLLCLFGTQITAAQNNEAVPTQATSHELFHSFTYGESMEGEIAPNSKVEAVNKLPRGSWQSTITGIIKILLNIAGALALIAFTFGGASMVLAQGKAEELGKAKKILIFAIVGLLVIAVSYAVVIGVSELQFFTAGR